MASAASNPVPPLAVPAVGGHGHSQASPPLTPAHWGMISFLLSEVAFFSTLIVTYITFVGRSDVGPTPAVLSLPLVIGTTICLLSSSATIHMADKSLRLGGGSTFVSWWSATIVLGAAFLLGTAYEWSQLIFREHLTISRNMFGTTYYTLVGFHALHVTMGVVAMLIVLALVLRRKLTTSNPIAIEMVSWYWHFVDGVWIMVFTVVYIWSR